MKIKCSIRFGTTLLAVAACANANAAVDCAVMGKLLDQAAKAIAQYNNAKNYAVAYAYSRSYWNIVDAANSQCKGINDSAKQIDGYVLYTKSANEPEAAQKPATLGGIETLGNKPQVDYSALWDKPGETKIKFPSHATGTGKPTDPFNR